MKKPNLLFILTDEQRADTLAVSGNHRLQMPHLNRLAAQSCVFERAYCTQPVCTPSRASLQTGLYPHQHRCILNNTILDPVLPTFAEMLPSGAYATGYNGKWHLGNEIFRQRGFDEWVSTDDTYAAYYSESRDRQTLSTYDAFLRRAGFTPKNGKFFGRAETARLPEEFGKPCFQAAEACRFLRAHRDEPFALFVSILEPHMPFFGPRDGQYDPATVDLPSNFDAPPARDQPIRAQLNYRSTLEKGHSGYPLRTESDWREMIARYWGLCSLVDTHVGTILATLEELGLMDDTIVVFTSDHGEMMGSHRTIAKCLMFEEAIRVPWLIKLPGQRHERRLPHPVSQIDLVPTLLDLLDVLIPPNLPGVSLRGLLDETNATIPSPVVVEWNGAESFVLSKAEWQNYPAWAAEIAPPEAALLSLADPVRTWIDPDGWKLCLSPLGEHELYHLPSDPFETHNLAFEPAHQEIFRTLSGHLDEWARRTNDSPS